MDALSLNVVLNTKEEIDNESFELFSFCPFFPSHTLSECCMCLCAAPLNVSLVDSTFPKCIIDNSDKIEYFRVVYNMKI